MRRELVVLRREFIIADMSGGVDQWLALARWGFNGFIKKRTVWWANLASYSTFLYFLVFVFFFKNLIDALSLSHISSEIFLYFTVPVIYSIVIALSFVFRVHSCFVPYFFHATIFYSFWNFINATLR